MLEWIWPCSANQILYGMCEDTVARPDHEELLPKHEDVEKNMVIVVTRNANIFYSKQICGEAEIVPFERRVLSAYEKTHYGSKCRFSNEYIYTQWIFTANSDGLMISIPVWLETPVCTYKLVTLTNNICGAN